MGLVFLAGGGVGLMRILELWRDAFGIFSGNGAGLLVLFLDGSGLLETGGVAIVYCFVQEELRTAAILERVSYEGGLWSLMTLL